MSSSKQSRDRVTIVDLAEAVGVTDGTVSRALAGDPRVKESTREKILKAADKMGYRPHHSARTLRQGKSNALAVFCEGGHWIFFNTYFGYLISGLARAAEEDDVHLVFYLPDIDRTKGKNPYHWPLKLRGIEQLTDGRVDGGIVVGGRGARFQDLERLKSSGFPLVLMSPDKPVKGAFQLAAGVEERTRLAVRALLEKGHKKIGMVGLHADSDHNELARLAIQSEMKKEGLQFEDTLFEEVKGESVNDPEEIRACLESLRSRNVTGIIFCDVRQAAVSLDLLQQQQVNIPGELSLVSFGPRPDELKTRSPRLSLVEAPMVEAGQACYQLFVDAASGKDPRTEVIAWSWQDEGETLGPPSG